MGKRFLKMEEWQIVLIRIKEYFRKHNQTNWGKNQIVKKLDEMEEVILQEKMKL